MNYIIYLTSKKGFAIKKEDGKRAIKVFKTKKEALDYAKALANKNHGKVIDKTNITTSKKAKNNKKLS